jgi:hypothetical protein
MGGWRSSEASPPDVGTVPEQLPEFSDRGGFCELGCILDCASVAR